MKSGRAILMITAFLLCGTAARADILHVEMSARGDSERQAIDEALRKALTAVIDQVFRPDASEARDRETRWARRLVLAHPLHVIGKRNYTVTRRRDARDDVIHGLWDVTLAVDVSEARLEELWIEAEEFLRWIGSPTVAVFITDEILDHTGHFSRVENANSDVAQAFQEALEEEFFEVKVHQQVEALREVNHDFAKLQQKDLQVLQEIASKQSAHLFLTGVGRTIGPTVHRRTPGRSGYDWESDAKVSLFWTDDATQLATLSVARALGSDDDSLRGAISSLQNAGKALAPQFMDRVFEKWSRWAFEGRTVTITVLGCGSAQADDIEDGLEKLLDGGKITRILSFEPANGVLETRVVTKLEPRRIRRHIRDLPLDGSHLVDLETRSNSLRLKVAS